MISGNADDGLDLTTGSSDTTVIGNIIGLDPTGTVALENGSSTAGGGIGTGSTGDTIGGTIAADRNIISGNYLRGITLGGTDEVVEGNYIGTDITGMIAIGNGLVPGYAAMYVHGADNTIGGSVAGAAQLARRQWDRRDQARFATSQSTTWWPGITSGSTPRAPGRCPIIFVAS